MERSSPEFAEPPVFDADACVRHSVDQFTPPFYPIPVSNNYDVVLEGRYLGEGFAGIQVVDAVAQFEARRQAWLEPAADLTAETRVALMQAGKKAESAFGGQLLEAAEQHNIVQTVGVGQASELFGMGSDRLRSEPDDEYGDFYKGWAIYTTLAGEPMLMQPATEGREWQFRAVYLDALHAQAPEVVAAAIQQYHSAQLLERLAVHTEIQLGCHETDTQTALPEFLREYDALAGAERARELLQVLSLLQVLVMLPPHVADGVRHRVWEFRRNVAMVKLIGDGRYVAPQQVLDHLSACPGETDAARSRALDLGYVLRMLTNIDLDGAAFDEQNSDAAILARPHEYTVNAPYFLAQDEVHEKPQAVAELQTTQTRFAEFKQRAGITDPELAVLDTLVSQREDSLDWQVPPRVNRWPYIILFTALYLSKVKGVNLTSGFQREVAKRLAGDRPEDQAAVERAWRELAALQPTR